MKYILGIVLLLIVATVYFITRPQPEFEVDVATAVPQTGEAKKDAEQLQQEAEEKALEQKRQVMQAEFEKLKKARRNLESRLGRLKAVLWGVEMPKEKSDAITNEMKNGYLLLKNKKLMGAYPDVEAITDEYNRVEYINEYLKKFEDDYREKREQRVGDN